LSNLEAIVKKYEADNRLEQILPLLEGNTPHSIQLTKTAGSQISFVLNGIARKLSSIHLFIADSKEEAAYMLNNIENISKIKPSFFPDSFKRPMLYEELDSNNTLLRTEVVNRLNTRQGKHIIISYPEALFEKVVDPKLLEKNRIQLRVAESLDVDSMIELLVGFEFERVDFVYEPGQFSIRGGIIDVFTYGNEWPYRVELFDDEIESIRTFNPMDQLSIERLQEISIIPNLNSKFRQSEKISLFELLPKGTCVWVNNMDLFLDKLQLCFERAELFATSLEGITNETHREIFDDRAFIYPKDVIEDVSQLKLIYLSDSEKLGKADLIVDYQGIAQPPFNKAFSLLIENLNTQTEKGFENYIFTDSKKQVERFYSIFEDLNANVHFHPVLKAIHAGFIDEGLKITAYTDHQIFERFHRYKLRKGFTKDQAVSLKMIRELEPGDYVVHMDHGIGRFSGLEKIDINGHIQESVRLIYQNNDILYVSINSLHKISKYVGKDGTAPGLSKIGGDAWKNLKRKTKKKVKDIAGELIKLYAKRKATPGHAFPPDGYLQNELEASFIYEDTPDQYSATVAVKEDMEKEYPMDRLICGDVGFGKTEVAVRAAFKAITDGKQVAVLVPTTILALQHYQTFKDRLGQFGVEVDYINRFKSAKQKKEILEKLESGQLDLIIGTHALLNKKVKFKDLGLLVIDEEQKFGVSAKEKLRNIKVNVDTLTLTATPIPRTLQFSLMAARDLSIIKTPPPNRQPIHTERRIFNHELIKDAIYYEVNRGGQVFFVHNRVKTLNEVATMVKNMVPGIEVRTAHGQMDSDKLEKVLLDFINGDFDVLVCTNIIETGLDISNANTIIINNANHFGMSDLHQLRGRVGRSNKKAYCYLFAPPLSVLTEDARKRLKTLEEFSDLGSGFQIAMKDLDIRGAGNLLGAEQSGFISDIGYETYQKILEEAIMELKENEFKELFKEELEKKRNYVRDVEIDTDIEMLIPDNYLTNIQERLSLYQELDTLESNEQIIEFRDKLKDRFGPVPQQVEELFNGLRLRWRCKEMGFEKLTLKNHTLRGYFISNAQSAFYETAYFQEFLKYLSSEGNKLGLTIKQSRNYLIMKKENVSNLKEATIILDRINEDLLKRMDINP
jgi:transcription-repair coupling factor (superfamily II helicase)